MTIHRTGFLILAFGGLTAFGTPNASGIYIINTPREVDLVQLIQTPDGKLTGRLEETTLAADGAIGDNVVAVDGAVSQRDLMFKPASVWVGGLSGTGTFTDNDLTIVVASTTLKFQRDCSSRISGGYRPPQIDGRDRQAATCLGAGGSVGSRNPSEERAGCDQRVGEARKDDGSSSRRHGEDKCRRGEQS